MTCERAPGTRPTEPAHDRAASRLIAIADPIPLQRAPVDAVRSVFRFAHVADTADPSLRDDFVCDRESGKRPLRREKVYPELREGMSAFNTLEQARDVWETVRAACEQRGQEVRLGDYIAELVLEPEKGFDIEDLEEEDGHVTIWGAPDQLAAAVCRIETAQS